MQNKTSNNQHNKNVVKNSNNHANSGYKNVNNHNKGHVQNNKNKPVNYGHKGNNVHKKVPAKVEVLDLNTATPEIETELPVKNDNMVPILEPDKNPTIVIPVVSTEPVTEPVTQPVASVPVIEAVVEVVTEPVVSTEPVVQPVSESISVPVDKVVSNPQPVIKEGINKKIVIVLILALLVVVGVFVYNFLTKEDRTETLTEISKSDKTMFMLGEEEFHIGDTVSELKKKGLSYEDNLIKDTDYIVSDSIAVYPFYYEGEAVFLGALYCPSEENCKYDDAVLIKANFYDNADVVIDETIRIGMYYDDIKDEYGKKDGKFYQDKDFYVWTFGDDGKIGEPYYLLRFNSSGRLEEVRIGVWWYEEEFEYTVK